MDNGGRTVSWNVDAIVTDSRASQFEPFGRQISPATSDVCGNKYERAASIKKVPWIRRLLGKLSVRCNCYKTNIYEKNVYIPVMIKNVKVLTWCSRKHMTAITRVPLSANVENSTATFQTFKPSKEIHEFHMIWNDLFLMVNFNISYNTHTHIYIEIS